MEELRSISQPQFLQPKTTLLIVVLAIAIELLDHSEMQQRHIDYQYWKYNLVLSHNTLRPRRFQTAIPKKEDAATISVY